MVKENLCVPCDWVPYRSQVESGTQELLGQEWPRWLKDRLSTYLQACSFPSLQYLYKNDIPNLQPVLLYSGVVASLVHLRTLLRVLASHLICIAHALLQAVDVGVGLVVVVFAIPTKEGSTDSRGCQPKTR